MKTKIKQNNSMYALFFTVAVLVGGCIWYACSADENDSEITFAEREAHSLNNARITTRLAQLETIKSTDLLELSNNRFVVAVSEKECDALDIDDSIYFEAQTMIFDK